MKNTVLFLFFVCFPFSFFSQETKYYIHDKGKVSQYEMSMTEYPHDIEASAVVIHELGNYYFRSDDVRGLMLQMNKTIKIKILKQAGLKYSNFEIPLYIKNNSVFEELENIEGVTYNFVDGNLVKSELLKSSVFEEKGNDKWVMKKFAMPDVKEGSVIEVNYEISTPFYFNMREWIFQKDIPVVYSKLTYRAVPFYEYAYILRGTDRFDEFDSNVLNRDHHFAGITYKEVQYDFGLKNIPAFKDEEYISSKKDYLMSINFQMSKMYHPRGGIKEFMTTWPKMCDDFLRDDNFGKYIKNSEKEAKKILPTLNIDELANIEKLEFITDFVKSNYSWNRYRGKYASQKVSDFIKKKTGNVADINLYLIGMLKAAGFQVSPAVLSTRDHGAISKKHPFQQFLNYVIAKVEIDDESYFIDATDPLLYYRELPAYCLNVDALVVKPKSEEWTFTNQKLLAETEIQLDLNVLPDDNIMNVKSTYVAKGHNAYTFRKIYDNDKEQLKDYFVNKVKITPKDDIEIVDDGNANKPFIFTFDFDFPIENMGGKLFIHPFCHLSISKNSFRQTSRSLPIDLIYISGEKYKVTMNIPEGYKVEYLPKPTDISAGVMNIKYSAIENEGKIDIEAEYSYNSNIYPANKYIQLKSTLDAVIKRFSEMIILVKK